MSRNQRISVSLKGHSFFDPLSFDDGVDLVGCDIFEIFDLASRPADLNEIDLRGGAQAEMQTQIILRKIAPATADFVKLRHRSRVNRHARANCSPVTLCSH
jgi:hypothetical protein